MKELTTEQKAQRYDEAIEKAKHYYGEGKTLEYATDIVSDVFPELKESEESEDENWIPKEIAKYLKEKGGFRSCWIAWLEKQNSNVDNANKKYWRGYREGKQEILDKYAEFEKQGEQETLCDKCKKEHSSHSCQDITELGRCAIEHEQKPIDKVEPKFHEGEWVVWDNKISCRVDNIYQGKESLMYTITDTNNMIRSYSVKGFDNNAHRWTIQDAKDGGVLVASDGSIFLFKCTIDCACKHYIALTTDGIVKFNEGLEHYWETSSAVHPATKEQRDTLMKAMTDAGYTFDFEKKELKKIEHKSTEWKQENVEELSEFENAMMHIGESFFGQYAGLDPNDTNAIKEQANLLLKLVPSKEWSEEDEETFGYLENVVNFCYCNQYVVNVQTCEKVRQLVFRLKSLCFQSGWSKDDITRINEIIETLNIVQANRVRTQRMHYNKATIDKNIDWLKSIKERVRPKQEWSEKDDTFFKAIIRDIENTQYISEDAKKDRINWLKSLRLRDTWKPSDEQMEALESATENCAYSEYQDCLRELIKQLKKLKE